MKIDIIVAYLQRYRFGHEKHFVPPLTGIHLAALTSDRYSVRVIHQQIESPPETTDADLVAISFFSGFAPDADRLAKRYRDRGKIVVGGGPHVMFAQEEVLHFFDAKLVGEAESEWENLLDDAENGTLAKKYFGQPLSLNRSP